jgi:hypothetical protein
VSLLCDDRLAPAVQLSRTLQRLGARTTRALSGTVPRAIIAAEHSKGFRVSDGDLR